MSSRKRKTGLAKRATAKGQLPKFHSGYSFLDPKGIISENQMMENEERAQRKVDNFWGQDKDLYDRSCEKLLMQMEDNLARETEAFYKLQDLHKQWDKDYVASMDRQYRSEQSYKQQERERYIKLISTSSISSETIIQTIWNNNSQAQVPDGPNPYNEFASMSLASQPMAMHSSESNASIENREAEHSGPVHMSIHLDSLQQSKAIIDKATYSFKQALKRLNTNSNDMEMKTQPFDAGQVKFADPKNETKKINKFLEKTVKSIDSSAPSTAVWESLNSAPKHIDAVDGHPEYLWDQEAMLAAVFNYLDTGSKGYLVQEDIYPLAHDLYVHSLLKYTVFWCIVKKKRWSYFPSLFEKSSKAHKNNSYFISESLFNYNMPTPPPVVPKEAERGGNQKGGNFSNNSSNNKNVVLAPLQPSSSLSVASNASAGPSLTYADWISAAEALAKETKIRAKYIRTNEEHQRINSSKGRTNFRPNDDEEVQRETYLSRVLSVGDCVWGLHAKSCVWLPAVIERIHTNYDVDEYGPLNISVESRVHNSHGYFTYDIWYPINQRLLNQSRAMSASRQLLTLPSSMDNSLLHPKPIYGERNICAFAFDLVDQSGSGVVELEKLVTCFLSLEFRKIVNTSLALYTIFATAKQRKRPATSPAGHANPAAGGFGSQYSYNGSTSRGGMLPSLNIDNNNLDAQGSVATYDDSNSIANLMENGSVNTTELNDHYEKNVPVFSILDKAKIPCLLPVFIDTFSYKPPQKPAEEEKLKPSKRMSMEVEDSNLRELLLLHGHLPAEIASMTKRSSTDVQTTGGNLEKSTMTLSQTESGGNQLSSELPEHRVDWISKLDFLEFCTATVDVIQYSIV